MFLSISEYFFHISKRLTEWYEAYPTFRWIWVPYIHVHSPYAHVFTTAGLNSLSEDPERSKTPFARRRISWSCVGSACAVWLKKLLMSVILWWVVNWLLPPAWLPVQQLSLWGWLGSSGVLLSLVSGRSVGWPPFAEPDWRLAVLGQTEIYIPLPVTRSDFPGHSYAFGVMIVANFVLFVVIAAGQFFIYWSIHVNTMSSDQTPHTVPWPQHRPTIPDRGHSWLLKGC